MCDSCSVPRTILLQLPRTASPLLPGEPHALIFVALWGNTVGLPVPRLRTAVRELQLKAMIGECREAVFLQDILLGATTVWAGLEPALTCLVLALLIQCFWRCAPRSELG